MATGKCRLMRFFTFTDERGKLTAIEGGETVPFDIQRVFFLHDLTPGCVRGGHATMNDQCMICVAGTCRVRTHDGETETVFVLDEPMRGVYVPSLIWREVYDCSEDCAVAVLSDKHYDAKDYIRDFDDYLEVRKKITQESHRSASGERGAFRQKS